MVKTFVTHTGVLQQKWRAIFTFTGAKVTEHILGLTGSTHSKDLPVTAHVSCGSSLYEESLSFAMDALLLLTFGWSQRNVQFGVICTCFFAFSQYCELSRFLSLIPFQFLSTLSSNNRSLVIRHTASCQLRMYQHLCGYAYR